LSDMMGDGSTIEISSKQLTRSLLLIIFFGHTEYEERSPRSITNYLMTPS
jgi:hypothetical protein